MNHPDVLIIGGGIIGLTTAYFLAKSGMKVTVADQNELGREASWAGAGIVPPEMTILSADHLEQLRAYSVDLFGPFSDELKSLTGISNEYHECGGIECLQKEDQEALSLWDQAGVSYQRIDNPAWLKNQTETNSYFLKYKQVRNPRHLQALIKACEINGVEFKPNEKIDPLKLPPAGQYLIAAGAWADELLRCLGQPPLVHPVRGQIVLFKTERPIFTQIVLVGHRYLVPRKDGHVLVGSTEEPEAGFVKQNTQDAVEELIRFAHELVPELKSAKVEKAWAGLRPGSRDGLPFIGKVPNTNNIFAAVGHFRAGVQLSPGTAEIMKKMMSGEILPFSMETFRLDRPPAEIKRPTFRS